MAYVLKVNTLYRCDQYGRDLELPGLLTQDGILVSHLRYLASGRCIRRGASWRERSVFACRLLIRFLNANDGRFSKARDLLSAFTEALEYGTIDANTQLDLTGLYWRSRKAEDARTLLNHITAYTDWLADQPPYKIVRANPLRKATSMEQRMNWCAYFHREDNIFLRHLNEPGNVEKKVLMARDISSPTVPISKRRPRKRFPETEIKNFLEKGWVRRSADPKASIHDLIDYKGRAITILMHYGGLRKSEVFHAYLSDVILDKERKEAVVRIYHPDQGRVPEDGYSNRRDYLARRFGMRPRTEYPKSHSLHAGWKAPLLTDGPDGYIEVNFYPTAMAKEFLYCFTMYLKYQRVDPPAHADHPFAFTNTLGYPETVKNFNRLHRDAVHRVGLQHRKNLGTTEHGHRHAYGYRLRAADLDVVVVQKAMHHKSAESAKVYFEPSDEDVREQFEKTERRSDD